MWRLQLKVAYDLVLDDQNRRKTAEHGMPFNTTTVPITQPMSSSLDSSGSSMSGSLVPAYAIPDPVC